MRRAVSARACADLFRTAHVVKQFPAEQVMRTPVNLRGPERPAPASQEARADKIRGADLVRERAEERRALVRVAPLRGERRAAVRVLGSRAHFSVIDRCERAEPLLVAAAGVVIQVLLDVEL